MSPAELSAAINEAYAALACNIASLAGIAVGLIVLVGAVAWWATVLLG